MNCKICSQQTYSIGHATVMRKHDAEYFACPNCGFIQTAHPYWLDEAYSDAITFTDIGLASRNLALAKTTRLVIKLLFNSSGKFVDYGGGYGLFVRLLRDTGFDFYRYDKYCNNLFAQSFDANYEGTPKYELLTAFEVFEHLVDPLVEMEEILKFSKNILFSTLLVPADRPKLGEWWYYGLEHGQHVSLYTRKSLQIIAEKFGLLLYSNGNNLHLMSSKSLPKPLANLSLKPLTAALFDRITRQGTLQERDYQAILRANANTKTL